MRDILAYLAGGVIVLMLTLQLVWYRQDRREDRYFRLDGKRGKR